MPDVETYDAVVVGGGVMGGAAALELARRGKRVALVEQFEPDHKAGSSHGPTRIFRLSYPDSDYVQLAAEAMEDWSRLERDSAEQLIARTGGIDLGGEAFDCADAMASVGVRVDELTGAELNARFPLQLPAQIRAIYHNEAGVIAAERTVETQYRLAEWAGVSIFTGTRVVGFDTRGASKEVVTSRSRLRAGVIVIAAGAWTRNLASMLDIEVELKVTREVVAYLGDVPDRMPVVIDRDLPVHYLVPKAFGSPGVKVGLHHEGREVDPDEPGDELIDVAARDEVVAWVSDLIGSSPKFVESETCLYTTAPGEDFILKRSGDVVVVSPCSGHGFKFSPRIGRVAADLVDGVDPKLPPRLAALNA